LIHPPFSWPSCVFFLFFFLFPFWVICLHLLHMAFLLR
jgi:hypothetical protein